MLSKYTMCTSSYKIKWKKVTTFKHRLYERKAVAKCIYGPTARQLIQLHKSRSPSQIGTCNVQQPEQHHQPEDRCVVLDYPRHRNQRQRDSKWPCKIGDSYWWTPNQQWECATHKRIDTSDCGRGKMMVNCGVSWNTVKKPRNPAKNNTTNRLTTGLLRLSRWEAKTSLIPIKWPQI